MNPMIKGESQNRTRSQARGTPGKCSIESIFPNRALLETLSLFLLHPGEEFYQRQIAQRTGRTVIEVQRALRRIEDAGLVARTRRGNRVYYIGRRSHPAFEDLKSVVLKTFALGDALRDALVSIEGKIEMAFIFGSFAAGSESPSSDIDLLCLPSDESGHAFELDIHAGL